MFAVQIDMKELTRISEIPQRIANAKGLMEGIGRYMTSSTQRKIDTNIKPQNAPLTQAWKKGGLTLRDTGKYRSSITFKADSTGAVVGTSDIQGPMLQSGGTIKPKNAKKLTLPAGWKTRQMMRKFGMTPRACIDGMKAAGYGIWRSKSGKALMAALKGARGKKGEAFVLFILKDKVTIPARRHFTISSDDRNIITEQCATWIRPKK